MINEQELLHYLGYKGSVIPDNVRSLIKNCVETAEKTITEKYIYKKYELIKREDGILLGKTSVLLTGTHIRKFFENCDETYLIALTVGTEADRLVRESMVSAPEKGVIYDSAFSVLAEALANKVQNEIKAACKKELTSRFSPGYGDLPLACQKDLLRLLDAQKKIGLFVTQSQMMTPTKSVTAFIGVKRG